MVIETDVSQTIEYEQENALLSELDKGIDDMESGHTLPHNEAMKKIREAVDAYAV